jgi:hypothetical protein
MRRSLGRLFFGMKRYGRTDGGKSGEFGLMVVGVGGLDDRSRKQTWRENEIEPIRGEIGWTSSRKL